MVRWERSDPRTTRAWHGHIEDTQFPAGAALRASRMGPIYAPMLLNIDFLDDATRPPLQKLEGLTDAQRAPGLHLRQVHDHLRANMLTLGKLIERAKGTLMARAGLSEPDAFRRLQTLSNEKNLKMVEIARMIVTAEEAFSA